MNKLFELRPDEDYPHDYNFDAAHRWNLPGIKCAKCGWTGGSVGNAYPTVLLPADMAPEPYDEPWPISSEEFHKVSLAVSHLFRPEVVLSPGTEFGPIKGRGHGRFGDVTWLNPWTPLISEPAVEALSKLGIGGFRLSKPDILLRSKKSFMHLEIEIDPLLRLDPAFLPSGGLEACPACGLLRMHRDKSGWDEDPVILASSMPSGQFLGRIHELESYIVATEEFVKAAKLLGFSDISFREMIVT